MKEHSSCHRFLKQGIVIGTDLLKDKRARFRNDLRAMNFIEFQINNVTEFDGN